MSEQIHNQAVIEADYEEKFKAVVDDTEQQFEQKKTAAKFGVVLTPLQVAGVDQQVALELIDSKMSRYRAIEPAIYGLYGHRPYFLMHVLPAQKMREFLNSKAVSSQALVSLWALFDDVYKSALDLKLASLEAEILADKLPQVSRQVSELAAGSMPSLEAQDLRLVNIMKERDIYHQLMPAFLQNALVTSAGMLAGKTLAESLSHYASVMKQMAMAQLASIQPVLAQQSYISPGTVVTFTPNNPRINPPLSKPEMEALDELIYLQRNADLGLR